jgi:hypothetical protein
MNMEANHSTHLDELGLAYCGKQWDADEISAMGYCNVEHIL